MMGRRGSLSINYLVVLIVGLLLIWLFIIPAIRTLVRGADTLTACPGQCWAACPDGYTHQVSGDTRCAKDAKGTVCCVGAETAGGLVRGGDITVLYNNDKSKPIANGGIVTLGLKAADNTIQASGEFSVAFGGSVKGKKCYAQVGVDGEQLTDTPLATLFAQDPRKPSPLHAPAACADVEKTAVTAIDQQAYLGQRIKYTIVVVDADCTQAYDFCDATTFTFYAQVPDRQPKLRFLLDGHPAATSTTNVLETGTHTFTATIDDPLADCTLSYAGLLAGAQETLPDGLATPLTQLANGFKAVSGTCFAQKERTQTVSLTIPETMPRAVPFAINLSTSLGLGETARSVKATYRFAVAPERRVRVTGPSPGLTREKDVDIACNGVACESFAVAYLRSPLDCVAGGAEREDTQFRPIPGLAVYGGANEGRWRFTLTNETQDGNYVCVRAKIGTGSASADAYIYSVGLWQDLPSRVAIDATPPQASVKWDPWQSVLTFGCTDPQGAKGQEYTSGCAAKPYSYAYVVDPLKFVASVLTGGGLAQDFHACPDPYTGQWARYNGASPEMAYLSRDVRVICVRVQDAAGNADVQSKLLYSGQEALAAFLTQYLKHT